MIGSGNVATILGRKMIQAGHEVAQVFSKQEDHARALALEFACGYTASLGALEREADLFVAALADSAIPDLAAVLRLDRKLIVHTAGAVSKEVLKPVSTNYGVLYPLQSIHREIPVATEIPLLIDGNTAEDLALLADFARTMTDKVRVADDAMRTKLHVAAVLVNNFTNHLYALAEDYCLKEGLEFSLLKPLIQETALRLETRSPRLLQTGPAARGDLGTIQSHLSLLEAYPEIKELYGHLTKSILANH
jgi:predicted short-subunit dehydrogenase-like oxidoreductase (DUF2520 family)